MKAVLDYLIGAFVCALIIAMMHLTGIINAGPPAAAKPATPVEAKYESRVGMSYDIDHRYIYSKQKDASTGLVSYWLQPRRICCRPNGDEYDPIPLGTGPDIEGFDAAGRSP